MIHHLNMRQCGCVWPSLHVILLATFEREREWRSFWNTGSYIDLQTSDDTYHQFNSVHYILSWRVVVRLLLVVYLNWFKVWVWHRVRLRLMLLLLLLFSFLFAKYIVDIIFHLIRMMPFNFHDSIKQSQSQTHACKLNGTRGIGMKIWTNTFRTIDFDQRDNFIRAHIRSMWQNGSICLPRLCGSHSESWYRVKGTIITTKSAKNVGQIACQIKRATQLWMMCSCVVCVQKSLYWHAKVIKIEQAHRGAPRVTSSRMDRSI